MRRDARLARQDEAIETANSFPGDLAGTLNTRGHYSFAGRTSGNGKVCIDPAMQLIINQNITRIGSGDEGCRVAKQGLVNRLADRGTDLMRDHNYLLLGCRGPLNIIEAANIPAGGGAIRDLIHRSDWQGLQNQSPA